MREAMRQAARLGAPCRARACPRTPRATVAAVRAHRARSSAWAAAAVLFAGIFGGCGGDAPACVDLDGDSFGAGCTRGPDCDDRNAARITDCDRFPPPDCRATPLATGCPCLGGALVECYAGPAETIGVGPCRSGRAACVNGTWGLCRGEVAPRGETCDGADQDCDGRVDDGVRSPCGGCDPSCEGGVWGESDAPFEAGGGLDVSPEGLLTLARETRVSATLWAANTGDDTLSKIDAASAREVARYRTGGDSPSRVAVDYAGDVWVANRAFDAQGSVTKIAGERARCVDRDGDGAITTSGGPGEVLDAGADECVLFTVPVGLTGEVPRALAIDGDRGLDGVSGGDAWVGLHDGERVIELDGITGAVRTEVAVPGVQPYAAHVDAWGTVWVAEREGRLARIDRRSGDAPGVVPPVSIVEAPLPCYLLYALDGDAWGRLAMTGFSCDQIVLYDPASEVWRTLATEPSPRGIALDPAGNAWVTHTGGTLSRFTRAGDSLRRVETVSLASGGLTPSEPIGVALDTLGHVWTVATGGAPGELGVATRLPAEPMSGSAWEPDARVAVGFAPHSQGDLTGATLRGGFVAEGEARRVFAGCPDGGTRWTALHAVVRNGAASRVRVSVRHAAEPGALEAASFAVLGLVPGDAAPPWALAFPEGGVLEVLVQLETDATDGAPRVERIGVEWRCPGPG